MNYRLWWQEAFLTWKLSCYLWGGSLNEPRIALSNSDGLWGENGERQRCISWIRVMLRSRKKWCVNGCDRKRMQKPIRPHSFISSRLLINQLMKSIPPKRSDHVILSQTKLLSWITCNFFFLNFRFRSLCTVFLRDSMGFLLVFDLTNEKSLLSCREWMNLLCQHAYCERPDVILVGNKADKTEERVISTSDAQRLAQELQ